MIFNKKASGFTLIEILIAITILSFMMISVYSIIDNNIRTKESVVSDDREFLQAYTAFSRFDQDVTQMYSPFYYSWTKIKKSQNNSNDNNYSSNIASNNRFVPSQYFPKANIRLQPVPLIAQDDKTTIAFMTMANRRFLEDQKQSRFAWVEYSLETPQESRGPQEGTSNLIRRHISENVFDPNLDFQKIKPQTLLKGVKELLFEFWSRKDLKWVDNLRLLAPEERDVIRAIRVTLTWVDQNGNERTALRVFRPLWPYFDVVKDQTERETAESPPKNGNQNQQGSGQ